MDQFINRLQMRLAQELPGEDVQFLMAPLKRKPTDKISLEKLNPRKSAVLILLFQENNVFKTLFIERQTYDGHHSGQIAFPGGKFEKEDIDLSYTALRETFEEIGVFSEDVKILGQLTDIFISASNFLVTPFIGYIPNKPEFIINESEVAQIIITELFALNESSIKATKNIELKNGLKVKAPYYEIQGLTIWGATAMIISELNAVIEDSKTIF